MIVKLNHKSPYVLLLSALSFVLVGCHSMHTYPVNDNIYHPVVASSQDVQVFRNTPARPYKVVAVVDSFLSVELTREIKRNQLLDLQQKAVEAGGDGIIELEALEETRTGMLLDPTLPTGNWKQGDFGLVFLRAKVVQFQDEPEWEEEQAEGNAPQVVRSTTNREQLMDLDSLVVIEKAPPAELETLPAL
ncbi:MAG: hypothetical protein ACFCU1_07810 [Sumerlaeia bacterium]